MPYNFVADGFHTTKLRIRLYSIKVHFLKEKGHFAFLSSPEWGLGATSAVHRRVIGKYLCDFLLTNNTNYYAILTISKLLVIIG